jgi:hypothetical protein
MDHIVGTLNINLVNKFITIICEFGYKNCDNQFKPFDAYTEFYIIPVPVFL